MEEGWTNAQVRLAALSSDSRLTTAARDGHNIIIDNPDLVSSAIHDVVTAVRERRTLNLVYRVATFKRSADIVQAPKKAFVPMDGGHYAGFTNPGAFVGALNKYGRPLVT
jgi:hypothetical protein